MIRIALLAVLPFAAPYVGWYLWKIFIARPRLDPATGDQLPPDFEKAPRGRLLAAGVVCMVVVIGGFLLVHDRFKEDPYRPAEIEEIEREERRSGR